MQWPYSLLPGTTRRSLRDWLVDAVMYGFALLASGFVVADTWSQHDTLGVVVDLVLGVGSFVALWWRRRYLVALGALVLAASAVSAIAAGPSLIVIFNAAIRAPRRALGWLIALAVAATAAFALIYPGDEASLLFQLVFGTLIIAVAVGWGMFVRARRALEQSLREKAERLESEQRLRLAQARDAERRRIAGEMHDVLAHRVTLLAVQAGALEYRPDAPPSEISQAAGVIRASAQLALQELRDVIGVLREEREDGVEPPQPTLDAIPALIDESRAAGMNVRSQIDVAGGEATVGRTAYRVVQEGLTNARKHAPAAAVDVSVCVPDGALVVEVRSRPSTTAPTELEGAGTGLIGLAERVSLAGGSLEHGRDESGDFSLRATLPWIA
jgi:signal transduction histidine kinase